MLDKQKFLRLIKEKQKINESSISKFLDGKVSESTYSKFINDEDYAITDKSLSEILSLYDIDLYSLLNSKISGKDELTNVKIKYQYGEDGVLKPLNLGDPSSILRSVLWKNHTGILCKYSPYEGWCTLYKRSKQSCLLNRDIYRAPCILHIEDKMPVIGIYSSANLLLESQSLINLITYEKVQIDFDKVTEIYPVVCNFASTVNVFDNHSFNSRS